MNWRKVLLEVEAGRLRAAYHKEKSWEVYQPVKKAILDAFKEGKLISLDRVYRGFVDKDSLAVRCFDLSSKVRMVPGGSSVRRGSYIAPGVIIMPPSYINIGVYIDSDTMVDSHVLVGSCAQIGKRVHLSAGVLIGGVLEPIGARPVIIEDDCFIGAGCILVEGVCVGKQAVLAPGVCLSKSIPIYDIVYKRRLDSGEPIPPKAVIIPGSRSLDLPWAKKNHLCSHCALIIKYRTQKTDASLLLEQVLR